MLKSLEISGFKSFAKKTEFNFKSRVTAIVGPNGSGKSNVAEAFRFVLGEQSIKSMRGKRGEDLIWNGSAEIGRSNRAGVKLVFNNLPDSKVGSKNLFNLDFDEIAIERVVNRDGSNEYYLNGSAVRLKDIVELLSQAHIGASGHHIISQGEADRILLANIKERREMIEDALGLKVYQRKREESERKLSKTEENIRQVELLRKEIAPHLHFLKKQVDKVRKVEELRLKLSKFYREYLRREQIYLERQREQIEREKGSNIEKINHIEKEMEKAKQILTASSKKDGKSEELIEIENKINYQRKEKDELYREIGKVEGEISANERNVEKIRAGQKSEEGKTVLLREVEELEKEISSYSEITKIIEKIRSFILGHKSNNSSKEIDELIFVNHKLELNRKEEEGKIIRINSMLVELNLKYQKIKDSIEKEKDSSREAEKIIFKISSQQSELRNKIEFLKEKEWQLSLEENDWKKEIQEGGVLLGIEILKFENEKLESENELASADSYGLARVEKRRELEKMKIRLEELGEANGIEMVKEYKDITERDEFLSKELGDLKKTAESLEILIKELLEKLDVEFKSGVEKINNAFYEFFSLMFGGGEAKLEVIKEKTRLRRTKDNIDESESDSENPILSLEEDCGEVKEGIEISVSLPRKRTKGLEMLSGGERALTSIALLFAISQINPPPFIILDETDAALDEANSKKYGDMIEGLSRVSQLILITHNRETMSRASVIYGVTMGRDGVSRLLSIAFDEAVAVAK